MEPVVTEAIALKAVLMGACRKPKIGQKISDFSTSELIWAEDKEIISPKLAKKILGFPLWLGSGSGSGYGDGSGYGYGSGDGYGYGYGDGSGYGYGQEI